MGLGTQCTPREDFNRILKDFPGMESVIARELPEEDFNRILKD